MPEIRGWRVLLQAGAVRAAIKDKTDDRVLAAMRRLGGKRVSSGAVIEALGASRGAVTGALHRLKIAGSVESHTEGGWSLK